VNFSIANSRAIIGNDISVQVVAEADEALRRVETTFDGAVAANVTLPPDTASYSVTFVTMGTAGAGMTHEVVVTAENTSGTRRTAVSHWADVQ